MSETDNSKKKKPSTFGQIVSGMAGMFIMIYVIDPDWGGGVLEAGLECGLGWGLGAGVYLIFQYMFSEKRIVDKTKPKSKKIEINCPECGRSLKGATQEMIGDIGVCPKCKSEFKIEQKDEQNNKQIETSSGNR